MLPGPSMATVEQIDPDRGKGGHGPLGTDWLVVTMLRRQPGLKSTQGTVEQSTWLVENCALPSPGQGQFVSPAFHSGF